MAEAAYSQSLDTEDTIREIIAEAPPEIQSRYEGLVQEADESDAETYIRISKATAYKETMDGLAGQIHQSEGEEKKTGRKYSTESREFDSKTGGEETTRTLTNVVEKLKAKHASVAKERRALLEKRSRRKWLSLVNEGLGGHGVRLVPNPTPLEDARRDGESEVEWHEREWKTVNALRDKVKATRDAPLPKNETLVKLDAHIDRLAAQPPDIGGFPRGSSVSAHGGIQIGNPNAEIGWRETFITENVFVPDLGKAIAFLFPDELKKKFRALLDTYDFTNAISANEKAPLLAKLEAELWEARRRVEAAVLACRAAGIKNRNRPKDTPWPILLDCLPPEKARLIRPPTKLTTAAPVNAAPVKDADFEDAEAEE